MPKKTVTETTVRIPSVEERLLAARNQLVMLMAAGTVPDADSMIVDNKTFLEAIRVTARDAYEHVLSVLKALDGRAHTIKAPDASLFQTMADGGGAR
jgi:hypothetical protein